MYEYPMIPNPSSLFKGQGGVEGTQEFGEMGRRGECEVTRESGFAEV
jgi:hypothetical protein